MLIHSLTIQIDNTLNNAEMIILLLQQRYFTLISVFAWFQCQPFLFDTGHFPETLQVRALVNGFFHNDGLPFQQMH